MDVEEEAAPEDGGRHVEGAAGDRTVSGRQSLWSEGGAAPPSLAHAIIWTRHGEPARFARMRPAPESSFKPMGGFATQLEPKAALPCAGKCASCNRLGARQPGRERRASPPRSPAAGSAIAPGDSSANPPGAKAAAPLLSVLRPRMPQPPPQHRPKTRRGRPGRAPLMVHRSGSPRYVPLEAMW